MRGVPGGEQRQVVLVEVCDRLGVVGLEVALGDLIDPRPHHLAENLSARFAPDGVCDHPDGVLRLNEAQRHGQNLGTAPDGATAHAVWRKCSN